MRLCLVLMLAVAAPASAREPLPELATSVNAKVVKLFGAGGFQGVKNFGTGVLVSPDGAILTVANSLLDTSEIVVHLHDGRRVLARVVATEPALDLALLKPIEDRNAPGAAKLGDLPHFNVAEAARRPLATPGDWVIAHTNAFEIAMRDEPVSVQRGVVAAVGPLSARRGVFDITVPGSVYILDVISNNPGAAGGALTDRAGRLLGLVGREVKNSQTESWVNYAIPVQATAEVRVGDGTRAVTMSQFVTEGLAGRYKPVERTESAGGPVGYHGITFVPDILLRTPPYVEEVAPGSPAADAKLEPNDLIAFVNGEPVPSVKAFEGAMRKVRVGTTVRLEIRRGSTLLELPLTIAPPRGN